MQTTELLDFVQVVHNPSMKQIDAAVIWLHGLGADGNDFAPIVPALQLPVNLAVRFIFPHAPSIAVTINGGMVMPAWYDILEMSLERKIDETQIQASAQRVRDFITALVADGVPAQRIIVAGFSQGGAVAYEAALSYPHKLAGLLALSTYFATKESISLTDENKDLPIFIGHGTQDAIVPHTLGQQANELLTSKGYPSVYKTYPVAHGVHNQEITDIGHWIAQCLQ